MTALSPFVVIDCETTGFGKQDRIVEIAAVTLDKQSWEIVDEYDTLINPERDTGPVHVHGITASMVEAAPVFSDIASVLTQKFHDAVLIAHNFSFDSRMLSYEFERLGVKFHLGSGLCTLRASGEKLIAACNRYGIPLSGHHRALADARATAALAREIREALEETNCDPARFEDIVHPLSMRTLRREILNNETGAVARIVSLARYPSTDEKLLQYLNILDWILDDGVIDEEERKTIESFVADMGISAEQRAQAHNSYLSSIIAAAKRDGVITEAEQKLIRHIADLLNVRDIPIPEATCLPDVSNLQEGMRVCFTGTAVINGEQISRSSLEERAALVGLQPVRAVTKKNCDLLVAADTSSRSGKARNAINYGTPIMSVEEFLKMIQSN